MTARAPILRQLQSLPGGLPQVMAELFTHLDLCAVLARVDRDHPTFWANPRCAALLGSSHDAPLPRPLPESLPRLHPDDRAPALARLRALRLGQVQEEPSLIRLRHAEGPWLWVEVSTHLLEAGDAPLVLWLLRDVSARQRLVAELDSERERLRTQREAIEQRAQDLDEQNRELIELVEEVSRERQRQRQRVEANARLLLLPQLERIRERAPPELRDELEALDASVRGLGSNLGIALRQARPALTERELEVCALIRAGLRTVAIARMLGLSPRSVDAHRHNIRTKLGLRGRSVNLVSHLAFLDRRNP